MIDETSRRLRLDADWREHGACRRPQWFHPASWEKAEREAARHICRTACPVLDSCRAWVMALEDGDPQGKRHGIYAGMTGPERFALEQSRSDVGAAA